MTPKAVMDAYRAINELTHCVFPYKVTRQIHSLKKRLTEEFEIVLAAEQALVEKYGGKLDSAGAYKFESAEAALEFGKAYQDMLLQESNIDLPRVDISKYQDAIMISTASIEALEDFVLFEEV